MLEIEHVEKYWKSPKFLLFLVSGRAVNILKTSEFNDYIISHSNTGSARMHLIFFNGYKLHWAHFRNLIKRLNN